MSPCRLVLPVCLLLAASAAHAHHPLPSGPGAARPRTNVGVDVGAGSFDLHQGTGAWLGLSPAAELALFDHLTLTARLPVYRLSVDGDPGLRTGLGDLEVSALGWLEPAADWSLVAGLGAELPTGDPELGLGNGHVELMPTVGARRVGHAWTLHAQLMDLIALEGEHADTGMHSHAGSLVAPHSDHELQLNAGALLHLGGAWFAGASATGVLVLAEEARGDVLAWAQPLVSFMPVENVHLVASVDIPVLGERRFGVRGGVSARWVF